MFVFFISKILTLQSELNSLQKASACCPLKNVFALVEETQQFPSTWLHIQPMDVPLVSREQFADIKKG
jgi:hypothetical protein